MCQTLALTLRSPEILAPARIPVAAGKKMAKTEKNVSPSRKYGRKFSFAMDSVLDRDEMCLRRFMVHGLLYFPAFHFQDLLVILTL